MEENNLMTKTFFWMFLGVLGTALMAWFTYATGAVIELATSGMYSVILVAELIVVLLFSWLFKKLSPTVVSILFFIYAMLNGVTLSVIFVLFELSSIVYVLLGTSALFGGLALYGYKTGKDLSKWSTILFAGLIIGIILSLINLIIGNTMLDIIINWAMVALFCGFTIYDMNKIKSLQEEGLAEGKVHIYGAMQLYLDFINLFIRILSLLGKRRR